MSIKDKKAVQFSAAQIKLEGHEGHEGHEDGQETITDIQNYLDSFNKEIQGQGGDGSVQQLGDVQQIVPTGEGAPAGTYFMDHAGHYYYQANAGEPPVMTMVSGLPPGGQPETTFVTMPAQDAGGSTAVSSLESVQDNAGRVILNTGDYQTVTIVPSDTNPGEVSYVLIVQQPEDEKDEEEKTDDQDLTVYDFDDGEENPIGVQESGDEDDKTKIIKIIPRKSQSVTQPHMCNYCNYTSPKRYLLSRHMKSHSEERPHKCSVCERGFKTLASLQNHVNTHTGTKPHRCKYCESAFTTSGELVRHVRYRHTYEKPHRCTDCDYTSVEMSKLRRHARCHSGERPYQCPHCTYASQDTFKLKRHLRTHTGEKPYECDICHMRFTQSNSLKAHKLIHSTADKPVYHCELCPATCGRKTDLRIHVQKLHTSEKPLKCKRCGKSFPDRYTYKIHNKTHEGEKCYKCDLCPYASISARHLESHMLIHTDQKPFRCDHCDQSFRQKQLLKRHQNLYHNPQYVPPSPREKTHRCPECNRNFRHKGNLIRHMAVHDPDASAQEKAVALKLGRQKKIQIIDGQQVTVMPGDQDADDLEDEEDELDNDNMMAVEGTDGQQYVVLEVIQLQDGDGQEQALAVVAGDNAMAHHQVSALPSALPVNDGDADHDENIINNSHLPDGSQIVHTFKRNRKIDKEDLALRKTMETQKDMQNCFGFDEEDEDGEDEEEEIDEEETKIHLL